MRILFDSKKEEYKTPFGTLQPGQACTLHVLIPGQVQAQRVICKLQTEDGQPLQEACLLLERTKGDYDVFCGSFALAEPGLYFYYFLVEKADSSFRLFKFGDETNMEAGDCWQVSCIPADFTTPSWAKGATIYQIFPDRFYKAGECDLKGKLEPYTVHQDWNEEVHWQPTPEGLVLNNDFYGGNFRGITQKMDYIASLGTTILYLNPISKSFSSHRYDTGDYKTPDPMLGTVEEFRAMCDTAHSYGIRVVLDGVYSHTGSNSLYFDKQGVFGGEGAYCSKESPYYRWYTFRQYPDAYESWWDFDTLPTVKKMEASFLEYVITGEDSVVAYWLRQGADGFRLDVVDELPNEFVLLLKRRIRQIKPDALLIGEVWEDASNKLAYDVRRRYFVDATLDSVMNYPFRVAILNYLKGIDDGTALKNTVMTIAENYPPQVLCCNMNLLGTHDTPRILTALVDDFDGSRAEKAVRKLSCEQRAEATRRLLLASVLQYTLPGAASLYYGDEAGMEGYADPFNRRPYPWGKADPLLLGHFRQLGNLRKERKSLRIGEVRFISADGGRIHFTRGWGEEILHICINRTEQPWDTYTDNLVMGHNVMPGGGIGAMGFALWEESRG